MKFRSVLLLILLGIIAGLGIGVLRIVSVKHSKAFNQYGSWKGTNNLALNKNSLLTTQVTLFALFALPSQEAVYLFATEDEQGNVLNGSNTYIIEGNIHDIKTVYWSITAYGPDQYLIPNEINRYAFNAGNLQTDILGNFKIILAAERSGVNWLPVKRDRAFRLVLRLYQGEHDFIGHLENAHLPKIKRM